MVTALQLIQANTTAQMQRTVGALGGIGSNSDIGFGHPTGASTAPSGTGFDLWSWLGDIVSRPERAVLGGFNAVADQSAKNAQQNASDKAAGRGFNPLEQAGQSLSAFGAGVGGAARGFASTNKADQFDGAKTIRNITTDVGKTVGDKSINGSKVPDVLQGAGGLAIDLAADPLSYIGIGEVAKGAKLIGGLLKAGSVGAAARTAGKTAADYTGITDLLHAPAAAKGVATALAAKLAPKVAPEGAKVTETAKVANDLGLDKMPETPAPAGSANPIQIGRDIGRKPAYQPEVPNVSVPRIATSMVDATNPALHTQALGLFGASQKYAHDQVLAKLPSFITQHFDVKNYDHVLSSGARATTLDGKGTAKFTNQLGTHEGWNLVQKFTEDPLKQMADSNAAAKGVKGAKQLAGLQRADVLYPQVRDSLKVGEALLDSKGAVFHADWNGKRVPISPGQVMDVMSSGSPEAAKALKLAMFNTSTGVPFTKIMESAVLAAQNTNTSAAEVAAHLVGTEGRRVKQGVTMDNFLAKPAGTVAKVIGVKKNAVTQDEMLRGLLDGLTGPGQQAKLLKVIKDNAASHAARFGDEGVQMSQEVMNDVAQLAVDPTTLGQALIAINGMPTRLAQRGAESGALVESVKSAADTSTANLIPGVAATAQTAVKVTRAVGKGDEDAARAALLTDAKDAKGVADGVAEEVESTLPPEQQLTEPSIDLAFKPTDSAYRAVQSSWMRTMDPLTKWSNDARGLFGNLYQMQNGMGIAQRRWADDATTALNAIAKVGHEPLSNGSTRTAAAEALGHYFAGTTSNDERVNMLIQPITDFMSNLIPVHGGGGVMNSVFMRTAAPLPWLNKQMDKVHGISVQFDIAQAEADAAKQGISVVEAAFQQSAEWGKLIDDAPQFMMSLSATASRAAKHNAIMAQAVTELTRLGEASMGPKSGLLRAIFSKDAPLAAFLPNGLRVTPAAGVALQRLNEMMLPGPSGKLDQFLRKNFDPIQQVWKSAATVARPGFHPKVLLGNMTANFMAEGLRGSAESYRDATKLLLAGHHTYTGVDALQMLDNMGQIGAEMKYSGTGEKIFNTKFGSITTGDFYTAMANEGIMNSFQQVQQIGDLSRAGEEAGALQKTANKLTQDNKLMKVVGGVSEAQDHWSKLAHAAQMMRKYETDGFVAGRLGQKLRPGSQDELMRVIAARVRQFHPDSTTLTNVERKIKRILPFYGWTRGALIAMAESAIVHPGRALLFPKASYNLAVANGVHPDSLADPFPSDQLFPNFLTQQVLGPIAKVNGSYITISPGITPVDIANTFAGNPVQAIAGAVSPFIKAPIELATGTNFSTGAPIKDWSDYVDQQLPGISSLSAATGYSVTGSLAGLATGQGLDKGAATRAGTAAPTRGPFAIANWLTGAGITDDSTPQYQRIAATDQANRDKGNVAGVGVPGF